jgi:UDP-glucose 4-epimerase
MPEGPIAITGAAGYIGQRLLVRLRQELPVESILALDVRPLSELESSKITFAQQSVLDPLVDLFVHHKIQTVVHLAFLLHQSRDPSRAHRINVEGTRNVLFACKQAGVKKIINLSSSTVYGPHPDNPVPLTEEHNPRPPSTSQYAVHKLQCEGLLHEYAHEMSGTCVSILRGCIVMGPSAHNFITQALFRPFLIGIRGSDPPIQFVHEDDLTELLLLFLTKNHSGTFNVAGPGAVNYSQLVQMAKRHCLWLPAPIAYGITNLSWALRLQNASPGVGLDFIRYPWLVSTEKLRHDTGYTFQYSSEEALLAFLENKGGVNR